MLQISIECVGDESREAIYEISSIFGEYSETNEMLLRSVMEILNQKGPKASELGGKMQGKTIIMGVALQPLPSQTERGPVVTLILDTLRKMLD